MGGFIGVGIFKADTALKDLYDDVFDSFMVYNKKVYVQ